MQTKRQLQVQELIKRHFSQILQQEASYIVSDDAFVTLTKVYVSPDLAQAKAYLSIYNTEDKQTAVMELNEQAFHLRKLLGNRLAGHLRRIPELELYLDDTLDEMERLNKLFDKLHEDNQMGEEE